MGVSHVSGVGEQRRQASQRTIIFVQCPTHGSRTVAHASLIKDTLTIVVNSLNMEIVIYSFLDETRFNYDHISRASIFVAPHG
jgi:hypothetical protein